MITIIFDGATDTSVIETEIIYVRLLDNGLPKNYFLALKEVHHANAEGVFDAINRAFTDK